MRFKVINDDFYNSIPEQLKDKVPEFDFDETDEIYLILFELSQFMIINIDDDPKLKKCCDFIDQAICDGGGETEDAIVSQIFQNLYYKKLYIHKCIKYFKLQTQEVFEKWHIEFLKDFEKSI